MSIYTLNTLESHLFIIALLGMVYSCIVFFIMAYKAEAEEWRRVRDEKEWRKEWRRKELRRVRDEKEDE
tara:strand:- start:100 stop:306 length:207 start_codon:yes stop_codon:yes gene_type:complete